MLIVLYYALVCAPSYAALPIDQTPRSGAYVNSEGSPLLPLLHNARGKIDIEIYTIKDKTVRTLLRDALKRGVNVRIVKDASVLGETCNVFGNGADTGALNPDAVD
jgi:phosphatidylserine/phosphatidylglycerophosphate/cardiolipin synthase-like enzyme